MRRLLAALLCIGAFAVSGAAAPATEQTYTLTAGNYTEWQGTPLTHIANRGDYFCLSDPDGSAYIELDTVGATSLFISYDAGNYKNAGTTAVTLELRTDSAEKVYHHTGLVPDYGVYFRTYCGSDGMYFGLPEGTGKLRLTISNGSAYFRNLNITLSSTHAYSTWTENAEEWFVTSEALDNVEIRTSELDHWILVGFVFGVALIMMISVKIRNKYRKGK